MSRVTKSSVSHRDLKQIGRYIVTESGNRSVALSFLHRVDACLALLARQPHMGRVHDDLRPGLRSHPFEAYMIIYEPMPTGIHVVRVLHAARDIEAMFH
ncbi:MAG: type II toxin-antitoxin system RelE/ParE family toxin [Pirellulaceae bacterium]|nr:type II toxin-antitoxin system RelE/ParE family toxin [Planctomycetales bacterium]